ncbi:MAG: hypothetical protein IBJ10_07105 [Phycisphaerales bacterium]|nr:hypothetical protein [Phycisphaerales bacterium]
MTDETHVSALLIDVGGLASTIACLTLDEPEETILWAARPAPDAPGPDAARLTARLKKMVESFGLAGMVIAEPVAGLEPTALDQSLLVLSAARDALAARCRTLIWPAFVGDDMEKLSRANDRVRLLSGLIVAETPGAARNRRLRIETPFLDFTEERLRELAEDLRAPAVI